MEPDADLIEELKQEHPITSIGMPGDHYILAPSPKPPNVDIWISDDVVIKTHRKKPFSWWQKKMLRWCFGWAVKPLDP